MNEHIIYQTMGFDTRTSEELEKDYRECIGIEEGETVTDADVYAWHSENYSIYQTLYFDDEQANLNVELDEKIIAIASMGLWDGRRNGYKELSYNLKDIFTVWQSCDDIKLYADRYDVRGEGHHHDGRNYVLFRKWADSATERNRERTLNAIYCGRPEADKLIKRYTRSIRPDVKKIYGW